jgi:hypothetical protein
MVVRLKKLVIQCNEDLNYTSDEIAYIDAVYRNMVQECNGSIDELTTIATSGEAEMKDDERLLRLDKVHTDMQDKYAFTEHFIQATQMISIQRTKEHRQIQKSQKLQDNEI